MKPASVRHPVSLILLIATLLALAAPASAQDIEWDQYPEVDLDTIDERYRVWFEEEVTYIITEAEREIFLHLGTDVQRDRYIERFWEIRDPSIGTPRNEYMEEHYKRLAYANQFLGRGTTTDGWRTDMGRVHIILGEPISKSRVHTDAIVYPAEAWFYDGEPNLGTPAYFYMMFYKRYGTGDFRIYSPLSDGPERLLNGAGIRYVQELMERNTPMRGYAPEGFGDLSAIHEALREVDIDLASAAISLLPSEAGLEYNISPLSSEIILGNILSLPERRQPDRQWALNVLTGVTESEVRYETLPVRLYAVPLIDPSGDAFIHFAALTEGRELNLNNYEDNYYFTFEAAGSLSTRDNVVVDNFEFNFQGELDAESARRFRSSPFMFLDVAPVEPGRQTFELVIENNVSHEFGRQEFDLRVPKVHPEEPTTLGPVLVDAATRRDDYDPYAGMFPFQYQDLLFIPNVDGRFRRGQNLYLFMQVLVPEAFEGELTARFRLDDSSNSAVRREAFAVDPAQADEHGVIAQLVEFDLDGLASGVYTVVSDVEGDDRPETTQEIRIMAPDPDAPQPFVNAQPSAPATDPEFILQRAWQGLALGRPEEAIVRLERLLRRDPDNVEALDLQARLLEEAGRYEDLEELLTPWLVERPNDAGLLVRLAEINTITGEHYDAIRYYERARIVGREETPELLNALASVYLADGNSEKARGLLEHSLSLKPEQPQIEQMLERIRQPTPDTPDR